MAIVKRAKSSIQGLVTDLDTLTQGISTEQQTRAQQVGALASLETTEKTNLVGAVNEVKGLADTAQQAAEAAAQANEGALQKSANLSDVASVATARTNLDVYSQAQVDEAIEQAKLALGTNHTVDTIAERDALEGLDDLDRVFVRDDGDGKWALYQVGAVSAEGVVTEWIKLADQDSLENSITAPAVLAALLQNDDVNILTDAEKAKLDALNADDYLKTDDLTQTIGAGSATAVPSTAAVREFVAEQVGSAGAIPALETVVVDGSTITLTNAPKGGVSGVLNFGTVRYLSGDGISYDAPVVATGTANEFTISTDTADQWNGFSVQVQYLYVPA